MVLKSHTVRVVDVKKGICMVVDSRNTVGEGNIWVPFSERVDKPGDTLVVWIREGQEQTGGSR